jgi:hypothetical protein
MNRTMARRLNRLAERLLPLPNVPTKCWQIVYHYPEGPVNGPVLKWGPGYKNPDASFDRTQSASQEEDD